MLFGILQLICQFFKLCFLWLIGALQRLLLGHDSFQKIVVLGEDLLLLGRNLASHLQLKQWKTRVRKTEDVKTTFATNLSVTRLDLLLKLGDDFIRFLYFLGQHFQCVLSLRHQGCFLPHLILQMDLQIQNTSHAVIFGNEIGKCNLQRKMLGPGRSKLFADRIQLSTLTNNYRRKTASKPRWIAWFFRK